MCCHGYLCHVLSKNRVKFSLSRRFYSTLVSGDGMNSLGGLPLW